MLGDATLEPAGVMDCAWTGAEMLMESCDPMEEECECAELKDADELWRLGRRRCEGDEPNTGRLHP